MNFDVMRLKAMLRTTAHDCCSTPGEGCPMAGGVRPRICCAVVGCEAELERLARCQMLIDRVCDAAVASDDISEEMTVLQLERLTILGNNALRHGARNTAQARITHER